MSLPSRNSPDPGDSGDFGVTDLSGDLGGSRDREAVSRMYLRARWKTIQLLGVHPETRAGLGELRFSVIDHGKDVTLYVDIPQPRGAVSVEEHTRAAQALDRFARERWGWGSKEWPDVVDAVAVVVEALNAPPARGAVDAERHAEVLAEMVKYRAQLATAVEERDDARREVAEAQRSLVEAMKERNAARAEARELVEATRGLLHALQWGDADQLRVARMEASEAVRAADHPEGAVSAESESLRSQIGLLHDQHERDLIQVREAHEARRIAEREVVELKRQLEERTQ